MGSKLLAEIGYLIIAHLRLIDFAFRYGGDEFVVLLPQTGKDAALVVAKRLRESLRTSMFCKEEGLKLNVRATIGVATYPHDAKTPHDIIRQADEMMYMVKNTPGQYRDRAARDDEVACWLLTSVESHIYFHLYCKKDCHSERSEESAFRNSERQQIPRFARNDNLGYVGNSVEIPSLGFLRERRNPGAQDDSSRERVIWAAVATGFTIFTAPRCGSCWSHLRISGRAARVTISPARIRLALCSKASYL